MVAILDADKEGFLRSETSLIQTIGRTARNVNAEVVLYADKVTPSMRGRWTKPTAAGPSSSPTTPSTASPRNHRQGHPHRPGEGTRGRPHRREAVNMDEAEYDREELIVMLEAEMLAAAEELEFEKAARLRDRIAELKDAPMVVSRDKPSAGAAAPPFSRDLKLDDSRARGARRRRRRRMIHQNPPRPTKRRRK